MSDKLEASIGPEYAIEPLAEALVEAQASSKRLRAVVVRMPIFSPRMTQSDLRSQVEKAFPGVPIIFADHGTEIEVIHAAE